MKLQDYEKLERRQDMVIGITMMLVIIVLTGLFMYVEDELAVQKRRAETWKQLYYEQIKER